MTAPPALADAPWVTTYNGMIFVEWPQVVASDLAGYRIYVNGEDALGYLEGVPMPPSRREACWMYPSALWTSVVTSLRHRLSPR